MTVKINSTHVVLVCQFPEGWQDGKECEESATSQKEKDSRGRKRKRRVLSADEDNGDDGKSIKYKKLSVYKTV